MTTLTLTLTDDQARRLEERAAEHGQSAQEYLLDLAAPEPSSHDEWRERLYALPQLLGKKLPALPDEALRRETMYDD